MNFIRRIGRDEIYIKYVHQLVNVSTGIYLLMESVSQWRSDASSISELRGGGTDPEIALRSTRVGSQFFRRTHGRSWASATISLPSEGDVVLAYT